MEVKFEDDKSVYRLITTVVRKAINSYRLVPDVESNINLTEQNPPHPAQVPNFHFGSDDLGKHEQMPSFGRANWQPKREFIPSDAAERLYGGLKSTNSSFFDSPESNTEPSDTPQLKQETIIAPGKERSTTRHFQSAHERILWQLHQSYIVTQTASGLTLIDQHAAHKRILFEQALQNLDASLPGTQQLLFAQTLSFSKSDFLLLKEVLSLLQRIGFSIQLLSGTDCLISGVPADVEIGDERKAIEGILYEYHQLGGVKDLAPEHRMAVAMAEQTAIKKGKKLASEEIVILS
jgi:DNA mismatch repair protein MutL